VIRELSKKLKNGHLMSGAVLGGTGEDVVLD
jgi:hypothetical protein